MADAINRLNKANFYTAGVEKQSSLNKLRKAEEHRDKRSIWLAAFTTGALDSYEVALSRRCDELIDLLNCASGAGVVDLHDIASRFAFDLMNDIGFTGETRLMADGDRLGALPALRCAR